MKNKKNIVFSEQIDEIINTLSISLTFIFIGLLLYFNFLKFGGDTFSNIIQWIFIIFGTLMIFTGLGNKGKNNPYKIKGFDSFGIGIFFLIIWHLISKFQSIIVIVISIIVLIIGVYGTIRGTIEILYSFKIKLQNIKNTGISKVITELILLLTKLSALILTILNILKALNIL